MPCRRATCTAGAAAGLGVALRVPAFTGLTVLLALGAHLLAGGPLPGAGRLLFAAAAVAVTWWPLAMREVSLGRLVAGVGAVQVGVHVALLDPASPAGTHEHGTSSSSSMLAAHVVAALVVACWLRRGETAVWNALRRILPRLRAAVPVPVASRPRPVRAVAPHAVQQSLLARSASPRRGPPVLV